MDKQYRLLCIYLYFRHLMVNFRRIKYFLSLAELLKSNNQMTSNRPLLLLNSYQFLLKCIKDKKRHPFTSQIRKSFIHLLLKPIILWMLNEVVFLVDDVLKGAFSS